MPPETEAGPRSPWALATDAAVVRRALGFAVGVGALLIAINHGSAIWAGELDAGRWWQMGLTALVPYCVSTASSVMAARRALDAASAERER